MDTTIYKLHAEVCKTLGNHIRIQVIDALQDKELNVGELATKIEVSLSSLSQHLSVMAAKGIIVQRKEGTNVYCRLSTPKVAQACQLMREVLLEHLKKNSELLNWSI